MAGKVLNLRDLISPDDLGCRIANQFLEWSVLRQPWVQDMEELRKYLFATDTTKTTNSKLPWKNKTTVPKLCQIRDNLEANYMASSFPLSKKNWFQWQGADAISASKDKRNAITQWMTYVTQQPRFKTEMRKCILDYIDYGNAFATVDWLDQRQTLADNTTKVGYIGPTLRRINPLDIVFNPTAPSFIESPKIIRTIMSFGEVKAMLENMSTDENRDEMKELFNYLKTVRTTIQNNAASGLSNVDAFYNVDGFTSFRAYLNSDYVEVLTFYGDIYDWKSDTFYKNYQIMVVDRHKVIGKKPNPSYFGYPPIFHVGWRARQDNLWSMSPLANLVGMQYRLDHVENLKADVFDLLTFPPLIVKGYVKDFDWKPMERIYVGDDGDVKMLAPPFQILQANTEIAYLMEMMEVMAGAPKEAMGFRSPGEKTKYEVQTLQNAAARIFQAKITQFEECFTEPLLNAQLEMSRRNITAAQVVPVFDEEFDLQVFVSLSAQDITGAGTLKPMGARHFAKQAEMVQNITSFANSKLGMDPAIQVHFSSIGLAKMFEELLDLQDYKLVQPYVRLSEQADAARLQQAHAEQVAMEGKTPAGLTPDDHDPDLGGNIQPQPQQGRPA
jgi:hypothetical protein